MNVNQKSLELTSWVLLASGGVLIVGVGYSAAQLDDGSSRWPLVAFAVAIAWIIIGLLLAIYLGIRTFWRLRNYKRKRLTARSGAEVASWLALIISGIIFSVSIGFVLVAPPGDAPIGMLLLANAGLFPLLLGLLLIVIRQVMAVVHRSRDQ